MSKTVITNIKSIDYKKMVKDIKEIKGLKIIKIRGQENNFKYVNHNNVYHYLGLQELILLSLNCLGLDKGEYNKFMKERKIWVKNREREIRERHLKKKPYGPIKITKNI